MIPSHLEYVNPEISNFSCGDEKYDHSQQNNIQKNSSGENSGITLDNIKNIFSDPIFNYNHDLSDINYVSSNEIDKNKIQKEKEKFNEETMAKTKLFEIYEIKEIRNKSRKKKFIQKKRNRKQHTVKNNDNKIQKMKIYLINSLLTLLNNKYRKLKGKNGAKTSSEFLKKIKFVLYKSAKVDLNKQFLSLTVKDLFSKPISNIYKNVEKDFNKKNISYFCDNFQNYENGEEIYHILYKTIEEMRIIYVKGDYKEEGFYIENDLDKIREKLLKKKNIYYDIDAYINNLRITMSNLPDELKKMELSHKK